MGKALLRSLKVGVQGSTFFGLHLCLLDPGYPSMGKATGLSLHWGKIGLHSEHSGWEKMPAATLQWFPHFSSSGLGWAGSLVVTPVGVISIVMGSRVWAF